MKIIAFYLPQFHNIPENDEWWGDGFTEWVNVKKAKPLFDGHVQPKVPLNENYYNLLDDNVKKWQANIAKKYGVYGFCYYHYWFNGKMLLEKPMEQMFNNKQIDMPFCISWANEPWTKAWVNEKKVLIPQSYGGRKEWKEHFDYLLPFLKDERYIKINGKPLFVVYRAEVIDCLNDMLDYWKQLAIEAGLDGLTFAYQNLTFDLIPDKDDSRFDFNIEFEPSYTWYDLNSSTGIKQTQFWKYMRQVKAWANSKFENIFGFDPARKLEKKDNLILTDYQSAWDKILSRTPSTEKNVPGAFVAWDNTPRKGTRGQVYTGGSPEIFEENLSKQIRRARDIYHKDMIFMYAWNEWAEGGYLEPDEENGYGYLEAIKNALDKNNEFPW